MMENKYLEKIAGFSSMSSAHLAKRIAEQASINRKRLHSTYGVGPVLYKAKKIITGNKSTLSQADKRIRGVTRYAKMRGIESDRDHNRILEDLFNFIGNIHNIK